MHTTLITKMSLVPAVVESLGRQLHFFEAGRTDSVATAVLIIVSGWHLAALTTLCVCVCVRVCMCVCVRGETCRGKV